MAIPVTLNDIVRGEPNRNPNQSHAIDEIRDRVDTIHAMTIDTTLAMTTTMIPAMITDHSTAMTITETIPIATHDQIAMKDNRGVALVAALVPLPLHHRRIRGITNLRNYAHISRMVAAITVLVLKTVAQESTNVRIVANITRTIPINAGIQSVVYNTTEDDFLKI